jgi:hypothetical protein
MIGIAGWLAAPRRRGAIAVTAGELVVRLGEDVWRRPVSEIVDGWVEDPHGVRLRLRDGTVLGAEAPDAAAAEALLRAAGVDVAQRVLGVDLTSSASRTLLGVPLAVLATMALGLTTVFFFGVIGLGIADILHKPANDALGGLTLLAVMVALIAGMLAAVVSTLWRERVRIGADGVAVKGMFTTSFVPYEEVRSVAADPEGVRLHTAKRHVLLPTWRRGEPRLSPDASGTSEGARKQRVILDRIRRAAALRQPGGPELAILDRAGRSIEAWRDEVRALAAAPADYRRVQLGTQDLEGIVTDATAPAERRIAAVLALGSDPAPATKDRIRIAIDTCADEELRAALERAAEDELDDGTLRRAIRGV